MFGRTSRNWSGGIPSGEPIVIRPALGARVRLLILMLAIAAVAGFLAWNSSQSRAIPGLFAVAAVGVAFVNLRVRVVADDHHLRVRNGLVERRFERSDIREFLVVPHGRSVLNLGAVVVAELTDGEGIVLGATARARLGAARVVVWRDQFESWRKMGAAEAPSGGPFVD